MISVPSLTRATVAPGSRPLTPAAVATVAASAGAVGLLSLIPGLPTPVAALLGAFFLLAGPGGAVISWLPAVPRSLGVAAIPVVGISLLSLIASGELALGRFPVVATTAMTAGLVLVTATFRIAEQWPVRFTSPARILEPVRAQRLPTAAVVSIAVSVVAIVLACVAIRRLPGTAPTEFGPLVRVPELITAVVLAAAALLVALKARSLLAAWAAVLTAVFVVRGPTLFATETALYEWTYRHVGVVDWFLYSGGLASGVDVYNDWPASLALAAWFTGSTGLDPLALAHGFQFGYHFLLVIVIYALARCAGADRFGAVAGTGVFEFASWVAQDYFSPQAFAYVLAAVVVTALRVTADQRYRTAGVTIALVAATAVFWSHPLTPVWIIAVSVVLVSLRAVKPWWVVFALLALYVPTLLINGSSILFNVATFSFDVVDNTQGRAQTLGSAGQQFTSLIVRGLSALMWVLTLMSVAAGLWRRRTGAPHNHENDDDHDPARGSVFLALIGFSAFILLTSSYGGEAIYRVFLFSLLGCGPLLGIELAHALHPRKSTHTRSRLNAMAAGTLLIAIAVGGLQGFLGGWHALRFSSADVETARRIDVNAGPNGIVLPLEYAYPARSTWRYVPQEQGGLLHDVRWDFHDSYVGTDGSDPAPAARLTSAVNESAAANPTYVVVSAPIRDFIYYFGIIDAGGPDRIMEHLLAGGWEVVLDSDHVLVLANPAGVAAWK